VEAVHPPMRDNITLDEVAWRFVDVGHANSA
jgi:hypothetical protein